MLQRAKKRGFTLMELSIVIALVAILGTVIISFSSLMSKRTAQNTERVGFMQEFNMVETAVESFIDKGVLGGGVVVSDTTLSYNGEKQSVLSYSMADGMLKTVIDGVEDNLSLDYIIDIKFSSKTNSDKTLYYCSVTDNLENVLTFIVYPRVGGTVT